MISGMGECLWVLYSSWFRTSCATWYAVLLYSACLFCLPYMPAAHSPKAKQKHAFCIFFHALHEKKTRWTRRRTGRDLSPTYLPLTHTPLLHGFSSAYPAASCLHRWGKQPHVTCICHGSIICLLYLVSDMAGGEERTGQDSQQHGMA